MPYFIYNVHPMNILEKVGEYAKFQDASARAKVLRRDLPADAHYTIKVVFGENELHAEDTLSQLREPQPTTGEDY